MSISQMTLLTQGEFSELSLHEKNSYLQDVARQYLEARGDQFTPLSKDALSRLRRYYIRRSLADLQLEKMQDLEMRNALERLSGAIRVGHFEKVLESEIPPSASENRMMRPPPIDDEQMMFFVPDIYDAPLKDDVNLMDVAPFTLSKTKREGLIRYELKDCVITIEGGAETGIANAHDYDIFLNMVTYLAEEMRKFRKTPQGSLPPRVYRPTAAQILKFCRRGDGGRQYLELEKALDRLQATRVKITNLDGHKRRATESFPLIGRYKVISRTTQNKIDQVELDIPDWVYEGVVNPEKKATILTLNPDYFLITKPTARFIYRLARKAAGQGEAFYALKDLHHRSGSPLPPGKFEKSIEAIVKQSKNEPLPDYDLSLKDGRNGRILVMSKRTELAAG